MAIILPVTAEGVGNQKGGMGELLGLVVNQQDVVLEMAFEWLRSFL